MNVQEINIYKTTSDALINVLTKLVETVVLQGNRIYILCKDAKEMKHLDAILWSYNQLSFLPHGTLDDPYQNEQTVLLGVDAELTPANNATIMISVDHPIFFDRELIVSNNDSLNRKFCFQKILLLCVTKHCVTKHTALDCIESHCLNSFIGNNTTTFIIEQNNNGRWLKKQI